MEFVFRHTKQNVFIKGVQPYFYGVFLFIFVFIWGVLFVFYVRVFDFFCFPLGMTDIARQTVEFLYEENGGMPRDLHLPTIEDIKTEAAKFTIDKVLKGTTVVIHQPDTTGSAGSTVVPKFAVRAMLKTFGLTGMVLDIDSVRGTMLMEYGLLQRAIAMAFGQYNE